MIRGRAIEGALIVGLLAMCVVVFCFTNARAASNESAAGDVAAKVQQLEQRVAALEAEVTRLRAEVDRLKGAPVQPQVASAPTVAITEVPKDGQYPDKGNIGGTVTGVSNPADYKVVVYSMTDQWYVQPLTAHPYTDIGPDGKWGAYIFLGHRYGALLVRSTYKPADTLAALPPAGGDVIATTSAAGR